jgi:hypothetical protein
MTCQTIKKNAKASFGKKIKRTILYAGKRYMPLSTCAWFFSAVAHWMGWKTVKRRGAFHV